MMPIEVPATWAAGLAALEATETGRAILREPRLASVIVQHDPEFFAYGEAVTANLIRVSNADLSPPQQASVLAHELTHCHDLASSNLDKQAYLTKYGLACTELSAHMNQGKVIQELMPNAVYRPDIDLFLEGKTVWAKSVDWHDRDNVASFLLDKPHYTAAVHEYLKKGDSFFQPNDMFYTKTRKFQCDANLRIHQNWQTIRSSVFS